LALTPSFKLVFISVLVVSVLCLGINVVLALNVPNPSVEVKQLIETCSTAFKLGFGAIVGLIGGKAL